MLMAPEIPRYIVWSTGQVDPSDPFQRRWLLRQVLTHGLAADIRALDFDEIERELDELHLPPEIDSLWRMYLEQRHFGSNTTLTPPLRVHQEYNLSSKRLNNTRNYGLLWKTNQLYVVLKTYRLKPNNASH
jgi:hypothetical protein